MQQAMSVMREAKSERFLTLRWGLQEVFAEEEASKVRPRGEWKSNVQARRGAAEG